MKSKATLGPVEQKFVLHWGEMGTRWGINRTVAQVHALLFLSEKPLHADHMVEALGVARSNISTCLKELQGWGIVRRVHVLGDKRDHFESMKSGRSARSIRRSRSCASASPRPRRTAASTATRASAFAT
jgi:DNA-binding transcriptional regulator GbsR (MarR family)